MAYQQGGGDQSAPSPRPLQVGAKVSHVKLESVFIAVLRYLLYILLFSPSTPVAHREPT